MDHSPRNMMDSASDTRTKNNSVRHQYRELSEDEKASMVRIKDMGAAFIEECHKIGRTNPAGESLGSRDLERAVGHMEDAVMRAVRHVTR